MVVLEVLVANQFVAKLKKNQFRVSRTNYLRHIISGEGAGTDPLKLEAMAKWLVPRNIKEMRRFLGSWILPKLVAKYGSIALSLTQLLIKGNFMWNSVSEKAFQ